MPMVGGHSDVKDVDDEIKDTLLAFKASIEEKAATTFETFVPVKYTKQVVAGMIYHIKVNVGNEFIHARVFQPLPHTGEPAQCQAVLPGQTADSEMVFEM